MKIKIFSCRLGVLENTLFREINKNKKKDQLQIDIMTLQCWSNISPLTCWEKSYSYLLNSIITTSLLVQNTGEGVQTTGLIPRSTHLVCRRGMGSEMQRKGSNVLLCFRQWGHVSEHLRDRKHMVTLVPEEAAAPT